MQGTGLRGQVQGRMLGICVKREKPCEASGSYKFTGACSRRGREVTER